MCHCDILLFTNMQQFLKMFHNITGRNIYETELTRQEIVLYTFYIIQLFKNVEFGKSPSLYKNPKFPFWTPEGAFFTPNDFLTLTFLFKEFLFTPTHAYTEEHSSLYIQINVPLYTTFTDDLYFCAHNSYKQDPHTQTFHFIYIQIHVQI